MTDDGTPQLQYCSFLLLLSGIIISHQDRKAQACIPTPYSTQIRTLRHIRKLPETYQEIKSNRFVQYHQLFDPKVLF